MRLFQFIFMFALSSLLVQCSSDSGQDDLSLRGEWTIKLDPSDKGLKEQWYKQELKQTVRLPGSLQEQGFGNDIDASTPWTGTIREGYFEDPKYAEYRQEDDFKVPFWLNPVKYYKGAAWYQKQVDIPGNWKNKQINLFLERTHWETTVFVDNKKVGKQNSLSTPHKYDLTDYLSPGRHRLSIRVDNRMIVKVGKDSHSITDHTQSNWNGITGDIRLKAEPLVHIEDVQIFPDGEKKQARVEIKISNDSGESYDGTFTLQAKSINSGTKQVLKEIEKDVEIENGQIVQIQYPMGEDPLLWSEFHPNLYNMIVTFTGNASGVSDEVGTTFGMREITTQGTRFAVNGRPVFLRGTLECAIFPKTGYPPTDTAEWGRIFRTIKKHGLNHMRFHSWCPPEAAFTAADKAGIYLQVECGSWANQGSRLGAGLPIDQWIYDESERIVEEYGNHPSFTMLAYGNEPAGKNQQQYLTEFVEYWKNKDNRHLYTSASGWPLIDANQFHVTPQPRIQGWGQGLKSVINAEPPNTLFDHGDVVSKHEVPIIGHEIGQWCVYPNFGEMKKYTGVLKPKNFEIFRDMLDDHHMLDQAEKFHMASGKLQSLCYKADIEAALRTPGFAGFQLLDLHDFPGQGSALVGVLDPFWDSKEYVSPGEFNRFCGSTVPLAEMSKRLYRNSETFDASVEMAHFGESEIRDATVHWDITDAKGDQLTGGDFEDQTIQIDNCQKIGDIRYDLNAIEGPQKITLTISLPGQGSNSWDFWVYPENLTMPDHKEVTVATDITDEVRQKLAQGGKVLLVLHDKIKHDKGGNVKVGFSPIFWNTMWTNNQPPHTMGILCDPQHPLFNDYPTEYHTNWQWWDVVTGSQVINLEGFPREITPLIQSVPDYHKNRKLAFAFEGKVDQGKMLVTSIDFTKELEQNLSTRQLYYSMLNYMKSGKFSPGHTLSLSTIAKLMK